MPVGGVGAAVEAKNAIRTSIKSLFPDRDCATLVRPMHDEMVSPVQPADNIHCQTPGFKFPQSLKSLSLQAADSTSMMEQGMSILHLSVMQ